MITISGIDTETGKICEINCKSYEQLLFKLERGDKGKPDKRYIFLIPCGTWYLVPVEEFEDHLEESENEDGACDLEIDLEEDVEGEEDGD